jgi:molybdopterin converting factor small subunit
MVEVKVRFITRMQKYSGQREIRVELPSDPSQAIDTIIQKFHIPWKDNLEKSTRIFINKNFSDAFIKSGKTLKKDDVIAIIPISGGG